MEACVFCAYRSARLASWSLPKKYFGGDCRLDVCRSTLGELIVESHGLDDCLDGTDDSQGEGANSDLGRALGGELFDTLEL